MPDFAESNTSLNWQMIYLGQILLGGDLVAQVFNWSVLPIVATAIILAAERGSRWFAVWLLVSTPFVLGVSAVANNDLGVTLFCTLMWLALRSPFIRHAWLLAGLFGGFAFGTKYPSLLAIVAMMIAWSVSTRAPIREQLRPFGLIFTGVTLAYLPWLIRNITWTGDPIYPVLSQWLPWTGETGRWVVEHYNRELAQYGGGITGLSRWLLAPWRATMAEERYFESEIGLVIWAVLPLLAWGIVKSRAQCFVTVAALIFGMLWAWGPQVTRFLCAGIPAFALAGSGNFARLLSQPVRRVMLIIFSFLVGLNIWLTWLALSGQNDPFSYFLKRTSCHDYLTQRHPEYRIASWLSQGSRINHRVLLLGVDTICFFKNPLRVSGPFDYKWIVEQASKTRSSEELANRLCGDQIHWIVLSRSRTKFLDQQIGYLDWPSQEAEQRFWQFLEKHTQLVRLDHGCELRQLFLKPVGNSP